MQYTLIEKGEVHVDESCQFIEGAVLAANLTTK
ncbi:prepilin peptidase, partial [Vibrio alginolyticus]